MEQYFEADELPASWSVERDRRLFIHSMLESAGVSPSKYPPTSFQTLQDLLSQIDTSSSFNLLRKSCLYYYLLKDYADDRAQKFAKDQLIPSYWTASIDGYHAADHDQFRQAVLSLCKPGVKHDALSELIVLLAQRAPQDLSLFLSLSQPKITGLHELESIVCAIASIENVVGAFEWARRDLDAVEKPFRDIEAMEEDESRAMSELSLTDEPEQVDRPLLISQLLRTIFGDNSTKKPLPKAIKQLLTLPLADEEDAALLDFASSPPADLAQLSKDVLMEFIVTRLVAQGRYIEAHQLLSSAPSAGLSHDTSKKRALLKKTLKSVMTELDLSILEIAELDAPEGANGEPEPGDGQPRADIAQHPWAAPPEDDVLPPAQSRTDVQLQADLRSKSAVPPLPDERDIPLSASPTLHSPKKVFVGKSGPMKNAVLAAVRSISNTSLQAQAGSPAGTPRPSLGAGGRTASGSPFMRPPRLLGSPSLNASSDRLGSPAPASTSIGPQSAQTQMESGESPARPKIQRVKGRKLHLLSQDSLGPTATSAQPAPSSPLEPSNQEKHGKLHGSGKQSTSKRPVPEPRRDSPSKFQAIDEDSPIKQSWLELTPQRQRDDLPGHFSPMDFERQEDEEGQDQVPEMREVATSPVLTRGADSSSQKPRHVRSQNAPEPPTPRRSTRLASKEPSAEPQLEMREVKSARGRGRRGRGK